MNPLVLKQKKILNSFLSSVILDLDLNNKKRCIFFNFTYYLLTKTISDYIGHQLGITAYDKALL